MKKKTLLLSAAALIFAVVLTFGTAVCIFASEKTDMSQYPMIDTDRFNTFSDLDENSWYYDYVYEAYDYKLMDGTKWEEGDEWYRLVGTFLPDDFLTREQFCTIISRFDEKIFAPNSGSVNESRFEDVDLTAWYEQGIRRCEYYGFVNGVSENRFGIGQPITREEVAVMMKRFIDLRHIDLDKAEIGGNAIKDKTDVSDWAVDAVAFMVDEGIMIGDENGYFKPKATITRAEIAATIARVYRRMKIDFKGLINSLEVGEITLFYSGSKNAVITDEAEIKSFLERLANVQINERITSRVPTTISQGTYAVLYDKNTGRDMMHFEIWTHDSFRLDNNTFYMTDVDYFTDIINMSKGS